MSTVHVEAVDARWPYQGKIFALSHSTPDSKKNGERRSRKERQAHASVQAHHMREWYYLKRRTHTEDLVLHLPPSSGLPSSPLPSLVDRSDQRTDTMGAEGKEPPHAHTIVENIMEKPLNYDSETGSAAMHSEGTLKRQLKNRHIAMIRYVFVSSPASCRKTMS